MFHIWVHQEHPLGDQIGYLNESCDEVLKITQSNESEYGQFTLDEAAAVIPTLDWDGCKLQECHIERVYNGESDEDA